ncbi:MAG TPA: penicillin-binding transpeptidase domain-containing protein [Patescibacteria group bacterium]|jgi:penicillin-binding protein 2|nr:penicillin-binding transpeptidase domain-containing protein [Patescibacteria group bacterium]
MVKPGVAFGDYISKGDYKRKNWGYEEERHFNRNYFLSGFAIFLFAVLFFRLFFLQIIQGYYYRYLSDNNRTKTVTVHAPRGIIFDRSGTPLVYNLPGFRESVNGKTVQIPKDQALSLIASGKNNLEVDTLRNYPYKDAFAHVLGYVGQISEDELADPLHSDYSSGDIIGKNGIEQQYEPELRGVDGKQLFEIDAQGNLTRKLGQQDPISGQNITLTLDAKLQEAVFTAMSGVKKGAAIVSTPKGEILALISKPSFDPNLFTMGEGYKIASSSSYLTLSDVLLDSQNQPLLNRAIGGTYPPGSTFKLIVASAGLKNNIIDENWQIDDTGILKVGDFSFSNWYYTGYGGTDGQVNIVKGIKRSNDIFFYKLAEKVGVDQVSQTAKQFGLGQKLGIDLEGEQAGLVPTQEWKLKNIGEQWYLGDTYHYGIGQGYLLTTPLQVNSWTQAIANDGILYRPHLLLSQPPQVITSNLLDSHSSDLIKEGMVEACSPGGVAWPLFNYEIKNAKLPIDGKNILGVDPSSGSADMRHVVIACKTGTAENGGNNTLAHAWITLFAPAYNPQIVVTILSENSGEGSNVAGPIAKQILDAWFSR